MGTAVQALHRTPGCTAAALGLVGCWGRRGFAIGGERHVKAPHDVRQHGHCTSCITARSLRVLLIDMCQGTKKEHLGAAESRSSLISHTCFSSYQRKPT